MKVALFGGTGFVGSYLIDCLILNDYIPQVLVRSGSENKIRSECNIIIGDIADENAVEKTIMGTEAIIYNIGIIRDFPSRGITYDNLHFEGLVNCMGLAEKINIKRFILMSANGVKENGTKYQQSKFLADECLQKSNLSWTIFRPSLIFGDPRGLGRPEFCTQLKKDMLSLPFPAPLLYEGLLPLNVGKFSMSPIHVENIAEFFIKSINQQNTHNKIFDLGGIHTFSWEEIIHLIALAANKRTWKMPAHVFIVKFISLLLDRFSWFPITRDQLTMLMEGNVVKDHFFDDFEIIPKKFDLNNLDYLSSNDK